MSEGQGERVCSCAQQGLFHLKTEKGEPMRNFLRGLVLGLAFFGTQFSAVDGASWFGGWGSAQQSSLDESYSQWQGYLDQQAYGKLFKAVDTMCNAGGRDQANIREWLKARAGVGIDFDTARTLSVEENLDFVLSYLFLRNYFGTRGHGTTGAQYTAAYVHVILCILLMRIAESILNVSQVHDLRVPTGFGSWSEYFMSKFLNTSEYFVAAPLDYEANSQYVDFQSVRDIVLARLGHADAVRRIAAPYALQYMAQNVVLFGLRATAGVTFGDIPEEALASMRRCEAVRARHGLTGVYLQVEMDLLGSLSSWGDLFDFYSGRAGSRLAGASGQGSSFATSGEIDATPTVHMPATAAVVSSDQATQMDVSHEALPGRDSGVGESDVAVVTTDMRTLSVVQDTPDDSAASAPPVIVHNLVYFAPTPEDSPASSDVTLRGGTHTPKVLSDDDDGDQNAAGDLTGAAERRDDGDMPSLMPAGVVDGVALRPGRGRGALSSGVVPLRSPSPHRGSRRVTPAVISADGAKVDGAKVDGAKVDGAKVA